MKFFEIKENEIESIESFGCSDVSFLKEIISDYAKKKILTSEFVKKFEPYIDSEIFSNSPMLKESLILEFPYLFDANIWAQNQYKEITILENPEIVEKFFDKDLIKLSLEKYNMLADNIPESIYEKYKDDIALSAIFMQLFPEKYKSVSKEIAEESGSEIFYKENLKDILNENIIENQFFEKKQKISPDFFILGLSKSSDIKWKSDMIDKYSDKIEGSSKDYYKEITESLKTFTSNEIVRLIKIFDKKAPAAFSYRVLYEILKDFRFDESAFNDPEIEKIYRTNNLGREFDKFKINDNKDYI